VHPTSIQKSRMPTPIKSTTTPSVNSLHQATTRSREWTPGQVGGCRPLAGHDRGRSWAVVERRPIAAAGGGRAEAAAGGGRAEPAAGFCWRPAPTGSRWLVARGGRWLAARGRPCGGEQRPAVCGWRRRRPQTLGPRNAREERCEGVVFGEASEVTHGNLPTHRAHKQRPQSASALRAATDDYAYSL
jgi:hypothetical protein